MIARAIIGTLAVITLLNVLSAARDMSVIHAAQASPQLTWRQAEIIHVRTQTHTCQRELHKSLRPVAKRIIRGGVAYRRWVLTSWRNDRRLFCGAVARLNADPRRAIRYVWGEYASKAIAVADCETGGTFSVWARNGQYLGLFQQGEWARGRYGHGYTPLRQAFAAYANFRDNGWSQWECA